MYRTQYSLHYTVWSVCGASGRWEERTRRWAEREDGGRSVRDGARSVRVERRACWRCTPAVYEWQPNAPPIQCRLLTRDLLTNELDETKQIRRVFGRAEVRPLEKMELFDGSGVVVLVAKGGDNNNDIHVTWSNRHTIMLQ